MWKKGWIALKSRVMLFLCPEDELQSSIDPEKTSEQIRKPWNEIHHQTTDTVGDVLLESTNRYYDYQVSALRHSADKRDQLTAAVITVLGIVAGAFQFFSEKHASTPLLAILCYVAAFAVLAVALTVLLLSRLTVSISSITPPNPKELLKQILQVSPQHLHSWYALAFFTSFDGIRSTSLMLKARINRALQLILASLWLAVVGTVVHVLWAPVTAALRLI